MVNAQIGGDQIEFVAFRTAHQIRVAHAGLADVRGEHRVARIAGVMPGQSVLAGGEVHLLVGCGAFGTGEVREQVIRGLAFFHLGLDGEREFAGHGGVAVFHGGGKGYFRILRGTLGQITGLHTVFVGSGDEIRVGFPRDGGAVRARGRQGQAGAHVGLAAVERDVGRVGFGFGLAFGDVGAHGHHDFDRHARVVLRDALHGEGSRLRVGAGLHLVPFHGHVLLGAVRHRQMRGLRQRRRDAGFGGRVHRVDRFHGDAGSVGFQHLLVLGAGHGQHGAVARLAAIGVGREVRLGHLVADHLPLGRVGDVGGGHRHVMVRTAMVVRLVREQVVPVAVHVAVVRPEQARPLARGERAAVPVRLAVADLRADLGPAIRGAGSGWIVALHRGQRIGGFLLTQGHGCLVLVDAVVRVADLLHGHVDGSLAVRAIATLGVDPYLRLREVHEIVGRGDHHAVVGQGLAVGAVPGIVEVRGPVHHVLADFRIPVSFRRPGVARVVGTDLHMTLLAPVHQVGGFPHFDVQGAVHLGSGETAEIAQPVGVRASRDLEIGGEHVELVAVLGFHDERIAQALLAFGGCDERRAVVQRVPVERVVAFGRSEADFFAADALAGEEGPHVGLVLGVA